MWASKAATLSDTSNQSYIYIHEGNTKSMPVMRGVAKASTQSDGHDNWYTAGLVKETFFSLWSLTASFDWSNVNYPDAHGLETIKMAPRVDRSNYGWCAVAGTIAAVQKGHWDVFNWGRQALNRFFLPLSPHIFLPLSLRSLGIFLTPPPLTPPSWASLMKSEEAWQADTNSIRAKTEKLRRESRRQHSTQNNTRLSGACISPPAELINSTLVVMYLNQGQAHGQQGPSQMPNLNSKMCLLLAASLFHGEHVPIVAVSYQANEPIIRAALH